MCIFRMPHTFSYRRGFVVQLLLLFRSVLVMCKFAVSPFRPPWVYEIFVLTATDCFVSVSSIEGRRVLESVFAWSFVQNRFPFLLHHCVGVLICVVCLTSPPSKQAGMAASFPLASSWLLRSAVHFDWNILAKNAMLCGRLPLPRIKIVFFLPGPSSCILVSTHHPSGSGKKSHSTSDTVNQFVTAKTSGAKVCHLFDVLQ